MSDRNQGTFTIPGSGANQATIPIGANVVLRGIALRWDGFGKVAELTGRRKLEDDLRFIVHYVLRTRGLLKTTFSQSDLGNLAALLKREIENTERWWPGQEAPLSMSEVKVTLNDIQPLGGVSFQTGDEGNLTITIGYTEASTGVRVGLESGEALQIPFDSYFVN